MTPIFLFFSKHHCQVRSLQSDASALRKKLKAGADTADRTAELKAEVEALEAELKEATKTAAASAGAHAEAVAKVRE